MAGVKQCARPPTTPLPPPVHPSPGSDLVASWLCSLPLTTQQLAEEDSFEQLLSSGHKQGGCYTGRKPQTKGITQQWQWSAPLYWLGANEQLDVNI